MLLCQIKVLVQNLSAAPVSCPMMGLIHFPDSHDSGNMMAPMSLNPSFFHLPQLSMSFRCHIFSIRSRLLESSRSRLVFSPSSISLSFLPKLLPGLIKVETTIGDPEVCSVSVLNASFLAASTCCTWSICCQCHFLVASRVFYAVHRLFCGRYRFSCSLKSQECLLTSRSARFLSSGQILNLTCD